MFDVFSIPTGRIASVRFGLLPGDCRRRACPLYHPAAGSRGRIAGSTHRRSGESGNRRSGETLRLRIFWRNAPPPRISPFGILSQLYSVDVPVSAARSSAAPLDCGAPCRTRSSLRKRDSRHWGGAAIRSRSASRLRSASPLHVARRCGITGAQRRPGAVACPCGRIATAPGAVITAEAGIQSGRLGHPRRAAQHRRLE